MILFILCFYYVYFKWFIDYRDSESEKSVVYILKTIYRVQYIY